jgi:hypothetical protein
MTSGLGKGGGWFRMLGLVNAVKHCLDFSLYFQLPYLPEETCFQQVGSSAVEGTNQALLGSPACHYF